MIQVVFMYKRRFINSYCNYYNNLIEMFRDIKESIKKEEDSIIEISLWNDKTKERK